MKKIDREMLIIDIIGISVISLILIFIVGSFIYYQKTGGRFLWE